MILCKVLNDTAHEVPAFLSTKIGLKHSGIAVEAMEAVAKAATEKSLEKFQFSVSEAIYGHGQVQFLIVNCFRLKNITTISRMII